jgi:hypothetical protein
LKLLVVALQSLDPLAQVGQIHAGRLGPCRRDNGH